jgi:hypothetical protein
MDGRLVDRVFVVGVSVAAWALLYGGDVNAAPDPLIPEGTYVKGKAAPTPP